MSRLVEVLGLSGLGVAALTMALRDPDALAVGIVAIGLGLAVAAAAVRLLTRGGPRVRSAADRQARTRALRRGAWIGAAAGILLALRAADGLTPLTAGFVLLAFALAEFALTARTTSVR